MLKRQKWDTCCTKLDELIPDDFRQNCDKFAQILKDFNKIHSLTNYKPSEFNKILQDSIAPIKFLSTYPKSAIDIGSGAGFPAIFLSFILKDCQFTLFEPNPKKSSFLTYLKVMLNLQNVKVVGKKIEKTPKFIADLITSRALMKSEDLLKLCAGFYDEKSEILLYKGSSVKDELNEINAKIFSDNNRNYILISGKDALDFLDKK